jgi:hypothetical protein
MRYEVLTESVIKLDKGEISEGEDETKTETKDKGKHQEKTF